MSLEDAQLSRSVMRDLSKHQIDPTYLNVHCTQGVVYLSGRVNKVRGTLDSAEPEELLNTVVRILKRRPGVRDVIMDIELPRSTILQDKIKRKRY